MSLFPSACRGPVVSDGHSGLGSHLRRGFWPKQRGTRFTRKKSWRILCKPCPVRCHMGKYSGFFAETNLLW